MPIALDQLPDDVDALKSLGADQLVRNERLQADKHAVVQKNEQLQARILNLQDQLNLALARRYAASRENLSPDQIRLFDEAEAESEAAPAADVDDDLTIVSAYSRKKRGHKPLPSRRLGSRLSTSSPSPSNDITAPVLLQ